MALYPHELKALAIELCAAMPPIPPRKVELVFSTGEMRSQAAMELARLYDRVTSTQRAAFDALAAALGEKRQQ